MNIFRLFDRHNKIFIQTIQPLCAQYTLSQNRMTREKVDKIENVFIFYKPCIDKN